MLNAWRWIAKVTLIIIIIIIIKKKEYVEIGNVYCVVDFCDFFKLSLAKILH